MWELAVQWDLPRKTVEDWVYRGAVPPPDNMERLNKFMECKHHWVIEAAHGPFSEGGVSGVVNSGNSRIPLNLDLGRTPSTTQRRHNADWAQLDTDKTVDLN